LHDAQQSPEDGKSFTPRSPRRFLALSLSTPCVDIILLPGKINYTARSIVHIFIIFVYIHVDGIFSAASSVAEHNSSKMVSSSRFQRE